MVFWRNDSPCFVVARGFSTGIRMGALVYHVSKWLLAMTAGGKNSCLSRKELVAKVFGLAHHRNVMETTTSFAPLAGRLAAKAAEIRPVAGAKVSWANLMALFFCAIFEMLILLCETLDARAAAEAARLATAPREVAKVAVPVRRAGRQATSSERRAPWLALVPAVQATTPIRAAAPSGTTGRPTPAGPRLASSRDPGAIRAIHAPPWRPRRETRPRHPPLSTPVSLL